MATPGVRILGWLNNSLFEFDIQVLNPEAREAQGKESQVLHAKSEKGS